MAGSQILEAFVSLFADDSQLKKSFGALPGLARDAGNRTGSAFSNAINTSITPGRAGSASPLQLPRVGGQEVDISSPFKAGFQQFKTARELADIQRAGGDAFTRTGDGARKAGQAVDDYSLSVRDAAGTARLLGVNLISELNPALGAGAGAALDAARNLKDLGAGFAVGGAGAAIAATALLLYITKAKEANAATIALSQAVANKDLGALEGQVKKSADAMTEFTTNVQIANSQEGLLGFKAGLEAIVAFWANQFGPGAEQITENIERQRAAFTKLFRDIQAPKNSFQAIVDAQTALQGQIGLDRAAAGSAVEFARQTDRLTESLRLRAEASADLIREEKKIIENDRKKFGDEVTDQRLGEVERRANDVLVKSFQEREQIRRDGARAAAEFDAKQREADGKDLEFRRRHATAVVGLAQTIVDSEASQNVSLEQVFQARTQLQRASTQSQLEGLKEESNARRAAIQERLAGATGSEAADIERELTQVTQEESAKRTEILTNAITQSIALAQKERGERLAQAEQVFSIQRSLNQRRLQDDIATQAAIAKSAQQGSQIQIAALQKVAEMTKQLQDQGRSAITQGINLLQQQAQRAGLEGPAFVSLASIQEGIERQRQRDDLTRRQLQAGESVRTEDAQSLASNPLEIFRQFGNDIDAASRAAFTPITEQFKSIVGDGISTELDNLTSRVTQQFVGLTTAIGPALSSMEQLFAEAWNRMIAKAEDGTSLLGQSLTRRVSDNLARSFVDAERRF